MRALAPLPALLLLAASAAACPFGAAGHFHPAAGSAVSAIALPEGKCTGGGQAPAAPVPAGSAPYDLRANPIPADHRPYWELMGYRFDDAAGRLLDSGGAMVPQAALDALRRPFDASYERLDASVWSAFMHNGYRLDESSCRLIGPDGNPLDSLTMKMWAAVGRRSQTHSALEALLAKLRGLDPKAPVPKAVREEMLALASAGSELPPSIKALLARNDATIGELRRPAAASYADMTKFYDGARSLTDAALSALPAGSEPGIAARRKGIPDPDERALGRLLGEAFSVEIAKTAPGRELLSHFIGPKGANIPDIMVLKLTQSPNDPHAPGAVYDYTADRMVINHWEVVRVLHARLPPEKLAPIAARLGDAKQLLRLLKEHPSLLPVITDNIDVIYFHELTHAAQSRRDRLDDEIIRGNLPGANPLSKEHEAHRSHCRYLLSKDAAAVARSDWRPYCMELLRDPDAFKDRVTSMYMSTFSGSATLDGVRERQAVRRATARGLEGAGGLENWLKQKLKQFGYFTGDVELSKYRADVDRREKEFLAGMPSLRREAGGALVAHYEKTGAPDRALALALTLPPGSLDGGDARLDALTDKAVAWVSRGDSPALRTARLEAVGAIAPRLAAQNRPWPAALADAYERDARSIAEELLAKALKLPREREGLLAQAESWAQVLKRPGDLPARIRKAAREKKK